MTVDDLVAWRPGDETPPSHPEPLDADGKLRIRIGRLEVPLAMHDHHAAQLLAALMLPVQVGVRDDTGAWMTVTDHTHTHTDAG